VTDPKPPMTDATGAPVPDNANIMLAHFYREVIPECRMHAKGWRAHGTFTLTHDTTRYTKPQLELAMTSELKCRRPLDATPRLPARRIPAASVRSAALTAVIRAVITQMAQLTGGLP
jgi:hypothetical protein